MRMWKRVTALLTAFALVVSGCGGSGEVSDEETVQAATRSLQGPLVLAAEALDELISRAGAGDLAGGQQAYTAFRAAFHELLGPISLRDALLAKRMAQGSTALHAMLTGEQPDASAAARQAEAMREDLAYSATALGLVMAAAAAGEADGQRVLQVKAVDYHFLPAQLEVRQGDRVLVRFENRGTQRHEFELAGYDVEIRPIEPGALAEISFVADRSGRFEYACRVDDHDERGMKGVLIVR